MKKKRFHLIGCLLLLAAITARADLWLTWEPPTDSITKGHMVYAWTNETVTVTSKPALKLDVGTNTVAAVGELRPGRWHFAVTAYSALGIESDFSNIVTAEVPKPPGQMRTLVLQYTDDLSATNWQDGAFIRIKIK